MEKLTQAAVNKLNTNKGLKSLLTNPLNLEKAVRYVDYERKLKKLQVELIRMQTWGIHKNERIIVILEGRDAAGKGGAIRRMTERINPRHMRIVALPKPNEDEKGQWYFQRYVEQFPKAGEIVFFDRSWYNRAVVEPVNGFCTDEEHQIFMNQVNDFERMILESGIRLVKIYMSINKKEQAKRFKEIVNNPLKQWKITPVDLKAQELWDDYTDYKRAMFSKTNTQISPWKVIRANRKTIARVNVINHVLKSIPYDKNTVV
ncbi:polyphosphate kinase 2 [Tenacibaculum finnmarkense]|uniref:ADP/GDP-polyphosphate phosphotransferase n=1 Tax=Tenacibaculum finnmarkense genomovar ulcerans TaxID=2781388 RepID=A0A2I2MAF7_9FLAO|nr:polyphosphate kinase 2 [Tenacibaculum finnmarkense]ALU74382.1 polyphosphate kinase [Tenacibaculum dicentrarchi]MBE7634545.1 polyphosphate kinase 2 [Tenacibaculum finnmarkense genomovar ulcerans]MBE7646195.1 polyphosphate kinase 2 [Tenacibaculum finnmarkense genomovar ulcerans]MBE7648362.1 polyphosphate kinase 2 [Tenacibaculum finnmarkense genomovar ulcerans]MBE7688501.1 polyphosphate kinase 2 [Tenacibaculum finnmarkense genomovar ulcerans]